MCKQLSSFKRLGRLLETERKQELLLWGIIRKPKENLNNRSQALKWAVISGEAISVHKENSIKGSFVIGECLPMTVLSTFLNYVTWKNTDLVRKRRCSGLVLPTQVHFKTIDLKL